MLTAARTLASIVLPALIGLATAQTPYAELETSGGQNDTPATSEDCTMLGGYFRISGTIHAGGMPGCDDEWYRFDAVAGDTIDLDMTITLAMGTGAMYQHNVWLYNSSEEMVAAWNASSAAPAGPSIGIETYCCDVDSSSMVTVLDALAMAQEAAGLMPVIVCL